MMLSHASRSRVERELQRAPCPRLSKGVLCHLKTLARPACVAMSAAVRHRPPGLVPRRSRAGKCGKSTAPPLRRLTLPVAKPSSMGTNDAGYTLDEALEGLGRGGRIPVGTLGPLLVAGLTWMGDAMEVSCLQGRTIAGRAAMGCRLRHA